MSIGRHVSSTIITRVSSIVISIGTSIFTARLLGVGGKGEFAIFLATLNISVLVFGLGMAPAVTYYVAKKKLDTNRLFISFLFYAAIVSCLFFGVIHNINRITDASIFLHENRKTLIYEVILCLCLFMVLVINNLKSIFSGEKQFPLLNRIQTNSVVIALILYSIMYFGNGKWWQLPVGAVFLAHLCIIFQNFLFTVFNFFKKFWRPISPEFLSKIEVKSVSSFAKIAYIGSIAQFINYRIDYWFIDFYHGNHALGLYALASNLVQMIWILPQSIAAVFLPFMVSGSEKVIANLFRAGRLSVFLCLMLAVLAYFFVEPVVAVLYGKAFIESSGSIKILLFGIVPFSLAIVYASYFNGTGRKEINVYSAIIGLVATIVLDLILIPRHGNFGAALATCISYSISTLFILYHLSKETRGNISDMFLIQKNDFVAVFDKIKSASKRKSKITNPQNVI